jgi:hypothetical protein
MKRKEAVKAAPAAKKLLSKEAKPPKPLRLLKTEEKKEEKTCRQDYSERLR